MRSKLLSKALVFTVVLECAVAGSAIATDYPGTPSTPTSYGHVVPYIIPGANPGGNRTCSEVGKAFFNNPYYYKYSSARLDYNKGKFSGSLPYGLSVSTNGNTVAFDSTFAIGAVIVKGGPNANAYVYNPQKWADSGLGAPINPGGQPAGLSNITFCWNPH
jgi:hypothetical protein